jgi:hypothetical protein
MNNNNNAWSHFFTTIMVGLACLALTSCGNEVSGRSEETPMYGKGYIVLGNNNLYFSGKKIDLTNVAKCKDSVDNAVELYNKKKISDVKKFLSDNYSLICSSNDME